MPYASSLSNNDLCGRQSKALDRQDIYKGVPQGSILGPVLFNIILNDIFHFTTSSTLYNYADDNTLAHTDDNIDKVVEHLEKDSLALITAQIQHCPILTPFDMWVDYDVPN
jgi:hypothetical protein